MCSVITGFIIGDLVRSIDGGSMYREEEEEEEETSGTILVKDQIPLFTHVLVLLSCHAGAYATTFLLYMRLPSVGYSPNSLLTLRSTLSFSGSYG
jgi:hypothetical protein